MTLQQIVQFIIDVLQAAVAASVIAATPTMQQMTELSPFDTFVYAAGADAYFVPLYFQDNGESRDMIIETWKGQFAANQDCTSIVFSAYSENYGLYMGMQNLFTQMRSDYPSIGPDDAEGFFQPRFGPDGESFAVIVQTPTQNQLLVKSKKWGERIVLFRSRAIDISDIHWVDDDNIAVTIKAGIRQYKKVNIPSLDVTDMLKTDYDLLSVPLELPKELYPTDNTRQAFLCPN